MFVMAGDWIKMRTNLDTNPRVVEIAEILDLDELYVVGMLWKVWSWADSHSIDGNAIRVTCVTLDKYTCNGFADALRKVGWLEGRDKSLSFPRFAEHNGQTAKKRAETKDRVAKSRNAKRVTGVTQNVLPEKRREEKRRVIPPPLACESFEKDWERWLAFSESVTGNRLDPIQADAILMALARAGPEKACRDIAFTIERGVGHRILDSDNDFDKRGKGGNSKRKEVVYDFDAD